MVEVPRHQIRASEQERTLVARVEDEEAAVFEEPAEDAAHSDRLAEARHARSKRADAARDDVDLGALLRSSIQLLDDLLVGQVVDLDPDASLLTVGGGATDLADSVQQSLP